MVISLNVQYNGGFLPYILLLNQAAIIVVWFDGIIIIVDYFITTYLVSSFVFKEKSERT